MEGSSSSSSDEEDSLLLVDDFYFSALFDSEELFPINDEKYAEELHLQEALYSSAISLKRKLKEVVFVVGESSSTTHQSHDYHPVLCAICMDSKPVQEIFSNQNCNHSFCVDCIARYVAAKIQENISQVKCPEPNCIGILEPQNCRPIIPKQVFERWENALCENLVLATSERFYCPFKDCSAMMVNDDGDGDEVLTSSECPHCHRLFCAQCKVPWHDGVECGEFMSLNEDERDKEDLLVMNLAKAKRWRRCSKCRIYVEKNEGCSHISCRCGHHFCYACGGAWNHNHGCP
ncbi:hypothetical protein PIB30_067142 [Stylosanthes scabra]|uniref:RBR-type E3 ubiquitin transferase n=1 Tax=Stylosanthes scabra TaxID=79078 RepID=A0ABU6XMU7_9FABA|nr:hypothetical protein [Stylosanthes scabra]